MARCVKCNRFMFRGTPTGYCKECEQTEKPKRKQLHDQTKNLQREMKEQSSQGQGKKKDGSELHQDCVPGLLRTDGIYYQKSNMSYGAESYSCIRFYSGNRKVIIKSFEEIPDNQAFSKEVLPAYDYTLDGNKILFYKIMPKGRIKYTGTLIGENLIINFHSEITNVSFHGEKYTFLSDAELSGKKPIQNEEEEQRQEKKDDYRLPKDKETIKAVNEKANKAICSAENRSKYFSYYMYMKQLIGLEGIQYTGLVSAVKKQLLEVGMSENELELIDYDVFIEPFVDEIDSDEDSYVTIQNKQRIMAIIRDHRQFKTQKEERNPEEKVRPQNEPTEARLVPDLSFHTKIVGVTFKNDDGTDRQRIIRNLTRNGELEEGTELFFVPQPTNPYDNNCILVNTSTGQTLGTLSKEMAATIAPQIKQGYTFKVHVSAQTGGDIGYAYGINILVERYR